MTPTEIVDSNEADFRNVISNVADSVVIVDQEGIMRFVNPSAEALFGRSLEELLGKPFGFPRIKDQATEIEVISKSGELRTAEMRMTETVWEGKKAYLASIRDFTELKRLEQGLREKGYLLAERVKELSCLYSISKLIERPRVSFEEIGRDIMALIPPGWQYPEITCARIILNGQEFTTENFKETNWKQSSDIFVHGKQAGVLEVNYLEERPEKDEGPFFKEERNLINAIAERLGHILERIKAEEALRESVERYRALFERSLELVYLYDFEGNFIDANDAALELLGYTKKDIKSLNFSSLLSDDQLPLAVETAEEILKTGSQKEVAEYKLRRKDGEYAYVESMGAIIYRDGIPFAIQGIARDITERKQSEEQRLKLEAQLQQSQKMEAIGTLAGGIAHDFNNILSAVIGYTQISLDVAEKGTLLERNLREVLKAGVRAKNLIQQILTFSRQSDQEQKPIYIKLLAKEALKLLKASLPSTIEIRQRILSDSTVLSDPTQIHQVLMNLCTNAGHAMRESGGVLEVSLTDEELDSDFTARQGNIAPGPYIKLTVGDTGHGMTPDLLEKIFVPYFTTKEVGEGTGMGLSVVHGIVKNCGGTITVYSELGAGTTFNVFLPIIETKTEPQVATEKPLPTGTERILFVDDEETLVDMAGQMLERLGYKVVIRTSSIEALELFKAQPDNFDLIITDMTMPNMTGDKLAREVMEIRSDIPIVLCTGYSARISEERAKEMGIKAFVMKPILIRDLANTVREVLGQVSGK